MSFAGEALGRLCLLGEHCDWYGGASLTVPFPRRLRVVFTPGRDPDSRSRYVQCTVEALRARGYAVPDGAFAIESDIPQGRGFSSSAALCVATARALTLACGERPDPTEIADVAFAAERHGVGVLCGRLDPLACAFGEPLLLEWGDAGQASRVVPIEPGATLHLVAAVFPTPRDTAGILRTLSEVRPDEIAGWGDLPHRGAEALETGRVARLGELLNEAQAGYERIASRIPALEAPGLVDACAALLEAGALGAKFSGAGGDGSVVGLARDAAHGLELAERLEARGLAAWSLATA